MDDYTSEEMESIEQALNRESFFNLTDEEINHELIKNLKLGKKYSTKNKLFYLHGN